MLQGAKDPKSAIERHRSGLQTSLDLLAHGGAWWYPAKTARGEDEWILRTNPECVELRTLTDATLYLSAKQNFTVGHHHRLLGEGLFSGWKAHTVGYVYSIGIVADPEQTIFDWHWHPPDPRYTHAHVNVREPESLGDVGKFHLPTSRVYFEQVIGFLIVGMEVRTRVEDWRTPLADTLKRVRAASTWHGDRP